MSVIIIIRPCPSFQNWGPDSPIQLLTAYFEYKCKKDLLLNEGARLAATGFRIVFEMAPIPVALGGIASLTRFPMNNIVDFKVKTVV